MTNKRLEKILKEEMGLNVSSIGSSTLQNSLARRMRAVEITDTNAYLNFLQQKPGEINDLIDEVVINETWFFRDKSPFTVLGQYAVKWKQDNPNETLRVLSIPCATGEEPYSIAITLFEAGFAAKNFKISAVDISAKSINFAQKAIYRQRSFRSINHLSKSAYFKKTAMGISLNNSIKKTVQFYKGNLINISNTLAGADYNIIFCRNLLIYIDQSFRKQALDTLDLLLKPDGILFVGHAEAGLFTDSKFTPTAPAKAFCFKKRVESKQSSYFLNHTLQAEFNIKQDIAEPTVYTPPEPPAPRLKPEKYRAIEELYNNNKFREAINSCEKQIKKQPTSELYYWLGLSLQQLKEYKTAVSMFKKSIYLDPNQIRSIEQLALLYEELGDQDNAQNFQRRTIRVKKRLQKFD